MQENSGIKQKVRELGLQVPDVFWSIPDSELAKKGCGPGQGLGDTLIPDNLLGLPVKIACIIHDVDFENGTPELEANERFKDNPDTMITKKSSRIMRLPRRLLATIYYHFVMEYGSKYRTVKETTE